MSQRSSLPPKANRGTSKRSGIFLPTATFTTLYHDNTFEVPTETVTLDEMISLTHDADYIAGYEERALGQQIDEYNGSSSLPGVPHKRL